jgi:hypothetical protein
MEVNIISKFLKYLKDIHMNINILMKQVVYIINQGSNDYNYNKSNICKIGSASRNNTLLDRLDSYGTYYPFGFIVNILLIPKYNINDYNHIKELMYSKFIKNEEITNEIDIILCELLKKHTLGINKTNNENYKSFIDCLILFTEEYIHSLLIKTKKNINCNNYLRNYKKPFSNKICSDIKHGEWFYIENYDIIINNPFIRKYFVILDYTNSNFIFTDNNITYNYIEPNIIADNIIKKINILDKIQN